MFLNCGWSQSTTVSQVHGVNRKTLTVVIVIFNHPNIWWFSITLDLLVKRHLLDNFTY